MEKDHHHQNYSPPMPPSFNNTLDYSLQNNNHLYQHHHQHQQQQQPLMKFRIGETSAENDNVMVDYMPQQQQQQQSGFYGATSFDKLSFADVMQFADFGPKLALNQAKNNCEESGIDPVYFLKFPVLNDNDKMEEDQNLMVMNNNNNTEVGVGGDEEGETQNDDDERYNAAMTGAEEEEEEEGGGGGVIGGGGGDEETTRVSDDITNSVQIRFLGGGGGEEEHENNNKNSEMMVQENKNKRKRPRTVKTSEEVESQRMTHITVERNRRKQMNEHLRVLRSLMPGSYVQRGDQASIIGGAIEFVRELEQLLQCLESQKRRRILGEAQSRQVGDSGLATQQPTQPPFCPPLPNEQMKLVELETGLREETAESKSCLADVEVKLLGFDAMIKILSRRRPGQLIKTIAALEDLQLIILHTNITTIEQAVLYSFNVKVASDSRFSAEDIASSVQQIFSFIHANTSM